MARCGVAIAPLVLMAGALIITIIPIMLIVTVLLMASGGLTPVAAIGFAALLALVGIVFFGLLGSARHMQASEEEEEEEDAHAVAEAEEERVRLAVAEDVELEAGRLRSARDAEPSAARWTDDGGAARP